MRKIFRFIPLVLTALLAVSCEKDPDWDELDSDYTVYTDYDSDTRFGEFSTYYLPEYILLPGSSLSSREWEGESADIILDEIAYGMDSRGYVQTHDKDNADIGLQVTYLEQSYVISYYGWWDYGFWGPYWSGWYYPYPMIYSYDTGTLIIEMVDLTESGDRDNRHSLPVVWYAAAEGLQYGNSRINMQLTLRAIEQAFAQSPYLLSNQ
jgi:hypothetical protein